MKKIFAVIFSFSLSLILLASCGAQVPTDLQSESIADKSIVFEDGTYGIYHEEIIYDMNYIEGHLPDEYSVSYEMSTCDKEGGCITSKLAAAVGDKKKYFLADGNETVFIPSYEGFFCYVRNEGEQDYKCINQNAPMDDSTVDVYENTFLSVCASHSDYCTSEYFEKIGKEKFCGRDCVKYEYSAPKADGSGNVMIEYRVDIATGICLSVKNISPDFSMSDTYIDFECTEFKIENVIVPDVKL